MRSAFRHCKTVAFAGILAACVESPTDQSGPNAETSALPSAMYSVGEIIKEPVAVEAGIQQISGGPESSFRVRMRIAVAPQTDIPNARITVRAPEVRSAEETGWHDDFRYLIDTPTEPLYSWNGPMKRGVPHQAVFELSIKGDGQYRVTTSVSVVDLPSTFNDVVHRTDWLILQSQSVALAPRFSVDLIADSLVKLPGPSRHVSRVGARSSTSNDMLAHATCCYDSGGDLYLMYYDLDLGQYRSLLNQDYTITYYKQGQSGLEYDGGIQGNTGPNGWSGWFGCNYGQMMEFTSNLWHLRVSVLGAGTSMTRWCGETGQDEVLYFHDADAVRVMLNMMYYIPVAEALFGRVALPTTISLQASTLTGTSWFNLVTPAAPRIELIRSNVNVWGSTGLRVQLHEYGHAFHHWALGGLDPYYTACVPSGWTFYQVTNGSCALLEGFAEFFAAAVGGPAIGTRFSEISAGLPHSDGWRIPGVFAAFLYDVFDSTNEEYYDSVTLPASYIGAVITGCEQADEPPPGAGLQFRRAAYTEPITYCLEANNLDFWMTPNNLAFVRWFGVSLYPDAATRAALRTLAKKHLINIG